MLRKVLDRNYLACAKTYKRAIAGCMVALALGGYGCTGSVQTNNFKSFADWCLDKAKLSPDAKYTIDLLLGQAGTNDCNQASVELSTLTTLYLNGNTIGRPGRVKSLINLDSHGFSGKRISDIRPLKYFTNLTKLDLGANEISDISPITSLTNLSEL